MIYISEDAIYFTPLGMDVFKSSIAMKLKDENKDVGDEELKFLVEKEFERIAVKIKEEEISSFLSDFVEFDDKVTFGRLFNIIIKNKDIFNVIYKYAMNNLKIDDFIEDFNRENNSQKKQSNFQILLYWYCVYNVVGDDFLFIQEFPSFGGFCDNEKPKEGEIDVRICFRSLSEYKDLFINMDCSVTFIDFHSTEENEITPGEVEIKGEVEEMFSADIKFFTLFDIFMSILEEITSSGVPQKRDEKRKEVEEKLKIVNSMKSETIDYNSMETKKYESMRVEELIKEQEAAAQNDQFEKAALIRDIIKNKKK